MDAFEDPEDPRANYTTGELSGPTRVFRARLLLTQSSLCVAALGPSAIREYQNDSVVDLRAVIRPW